MADPSAELLFVKIGLEGDECGVISADATVAGPGMIPSGPLPLTVRTSAIEGTLQVPAGPDRLIAISAYDAAHRRVYYGSTRIDVDAGQTNTANVALYRDTTVCPSVGTVVIVGTLDGGNGGSDGGTPTDGGVDTGTEDAGIVLTGPGLAFTATEIDLTQDGVLHFFDRAANRVHRLDLDTQSMLPPLLGSLTAQSFAVAPDGSEAYIGYTGGRIDTFDLVNETSRFFAAAPDTVSTMIVAGGHLFTIDASGAWDTQSLFDRATGARVSHVDWRHTSRSIVYSPIHESVYFLNSGVSPTDINMVSVAGGVLGAEKDSPYHGDYNLPNPIRLLPDERAVIVGSGNIFSATDLTYQTSIGLTFTDVAFHASQMHIIDTVGSNTQIRTLDSGYTILGARWFPGTSRRIFVYQGQLVLVTERNGGTEVRILSP